MQIDALVRYLNEYLQVSAFQDYAPNGLQVAGTQEVKRIVTGVTACQSLIEAAIEYKADALLVHHGYFWKNEPAPIVGMKQKRIKSLLINDINLLGYHLPLDAHPKVGNNAMLGQLWELEDITPEPGLVRLGRLPEPMAIEQFIERVATSLNRPPLHLPGGPEMVQTIAWCSGGAQNSIQTAIDWQADVYLSGEVSEQTTHQAAESGIHYLAAGHHATEMFGIQALGAHLKAEFGLEIHFVDTQNPV